MRRAITALLSLALRVFFRRVTVQGIEKVPTSGPAILVLNHPNGLLDPLLVLFRTPRDVSFLAKEPLFRMPIVGSLVKALDCIPVFRKEDNADPRKNRVTFEKARDVLARGGVIALFPEGTTHSDPRLRPLKTGAARIALGAAASLPATRTAGGADSGSSAGSGDPGLSIVPTGLTFSDKATFRSSALVLFGQPFEVVPVPMDEHGEPPGDDVHALTRRIDQALAGVTLQAEEDVALRLADKAEAILTADIGRAEGRLDEAFQVRKALLDGYSRARLEKPEELARLVSRLVRFEALLARLGLHPHALSPGRYSATRVARTVGTTMLLCLALVPFAILGLVLNYPAYRLTGMLAHRVTRGELSVLATGKVLAGFCLFPVTWILVALAVRRFAGADAFALALAALVAVPLCGLAAVILIERLDDVIASARAWWILMTRRQAFMMLTNERDRLKDAILALGQDLHAMPVENAPVENAET